MNSDITLELKKVSKYYNDSVRRLEIINNLDLKVYEGEMVAILGRSGSGKSTLLNLIGLLDSVDSGNIYIDKENITKLKGQEVDYVRNEMIGFVFQFHYLLPEFNALENVMLPALKKSYKAKAKIKKRATELLNDVGLGERINHLPSELSGGEKQRVAIARALINNPKIILADEPTGNLDEETGSVIADLFKKICKKNKQAIIFVTHSQELANICNRQLYLSHGQLENK